MAVFQKLLAECYQALPAEGQEELRAKIVKALRGQLGPRVLIVTPSFEQVDADFWLSSITLMAFEGGLPGWINPRSSLVPQARDEGVEIAIKKRGAEWILWLDSDMVFPPATLTRLLAHDKDIVGAVYCRRTPPLAIMGVPLDAVALHRQEPPADGLIEMAAMPAGCLLTRASVFEKLGPFYFELVYNHKLGKVTGEDYSFCNKARALGYRVWCDTLLSEEIGHVGKVILYNEDAVPEVTGAELGRTRAELEAAGI